MEYLFNHHFISTNYASHQPPSLPSHNPTASPPSPVHVHMYIEFHHQTTHRFFNRPHHDDENDNHNRRPDQLITTVHCPATSASISISATDVMQPHPTSYQRVIHVLTNLGIHRPFQEQMADEVFIEGRMLLDLPSNAGLRVVPVLVELGTVLGHTRDEREWVERGLLMESALEEGERRGDGGMVAAEAEAVRELKRERVVEVRGESCRVCLEEYVKGEKVTCMPCGHVFHEGCIKTWLGTSHCCPICRFKMPTAD